FVLVPMTEQMFRAANIPRRLMPAAICLGAFTFTMSALPGSPSVNNAIPMPYFGTTPFAAPGLGIIASIVTMAFGMWWLNRAEAGGTGGKEGGGGLWRHGVRRASRQRDDPGECDIERRIRPRRDTPWQTLDRRSCHWHRRTAAHRGYRGELPDVACRTPTARF